MTQILITIPDGASGADATVMTLANGDYSLSANAINDKKMLKSLVDATREATRYYADALRELEIRRDMLKQRGFSVEED